MKKKLYLVLIILLSWLSVPFIGKKDFKRFYPAAIFMGFYVLIEGVIAEKNKWWTIKTRFHPKLSGELPLVLGPFFAGSIWILKLTYGKPLFYILLNTVVDAFFAYPFYNLVQKNRNMETTAFFTDEAVYAVFAEVDLHVCFPPHLCG